MSKHLQPSPGSAVPRRKAVEYGYPTLHPTNTNIALLRLVASLDTGKSEEVVICSPEVAERLGFTEAVVPEGWVWVQETKSKPQAIRYHLTQALQAKLLSWLLVGCMTVAIAGLVALAYLGLKSAGIVS
ncbi:hypothetical protein D3C77_34330 [compost metagenome]